MTKYNKKLSSKSLNNTDVKAIGPQNPEVSEIKQPRRFTIAYKSRILAEADKCTNQGEMGALLRREGIYQGYIHKWRVKRDNGSFNPKISKNTASKCLEHTDSTAKVVSLEKQNASLEKRLQQAIAIIEAQKKISEILGLSLAVQNLSEKI